MLVRICAVFVAMAIVTQAIDPRLLRRHRTTPAPVQDMHSHADLVENHEHLNRRLEDLERRLEASLAQIVQLQSTAREVPRLTRKINHAERNIAELEDSLDERCTCSNPGSILPGGGNGDDGENDRRPPSDDWVSKMDKETIRNMRQAMNRDRADRNRNSGALNAQGGPRKELDSNVIEEFSLALAEIVTNKAVANGRMGRLFFHPLEDEIIDEAEVDEHVVLTTPASSIPDQPEPRKPRPGGGLPFPSRRRTREVTTTEEEAIVELQDAFTDVLRSANKKVAFSSIRTEPLFGAVYPKPLNFQKNQANKGKAFDRGSGIFECEIPGIYYFSYTMRSYDQKHIGVALMKNDDAVVAMTTDASLRKVMQTQSTMLSLVKGDQVWLLLGPSEDFGIYGNDFNYNTFNGHILYPNYIT